MGWWCRHPACHLAFSCEERVHRLFPEALALILDRSHCNGRPSPVRLSGLPMSITGMPNFFLGPCTAQRPRRLLSPPRHCAAQLANLGRMQPIVSSSWTIPPRGLNHVTQIPTLSNFFWSFDSPPRTLCVRTPLSFAVQGRQSISASLARHR